MKNWRLCYIAPKMDLSTTEAAFQPLNSSFSALNSRPQAFAPSKLVKISYRPTITLNMSNIAVQVPAGAQVPKTTLDLEWEELIQLRDVFIDPFVEKFDAAISWPPSTFLNASQRTARLERVKEQQRDGMLLSDDFYGT